MREVDQLDPESEVSLTLIGKIVADRYRVEALLGQGGMGAVYRAEHVTMRKKVALKVLHREMTAVAEARLRFEREAIAAGRIDHPNVVNATDFGKLEDGSSYLVLDYVVGRSLSAVLQESGTLPPERAVHITRQLVSALTTAHAAGVVHRDLKPDNVMLIEQNGDPDFVKVLDFGIAKVQPHGDVGTIQQLTQHGSVFGTPDYMSPEQAAGTGVDHRSDLYTVGIILYEMLLGVTPFHSENILVMLTRHLTEPAPELPQHVPQGLRLIVERLLKKAPDDRYSSAEHLLEALGGNRQRSAPQLPRSFSAPTRMPPEELAREPRSGSGPDKVARLRIELSSLGGELMAAPARALRALASRRVPVGGRHLPLWGLAVGAASAGAVAALTGSVLLRAPVPVELPAPERDAALLSVGTSDEELARQAAAGDPAAIRELETQTPSERGAGTWLSLGHGYCLASNFGPALAAYQEAAQKNPEVTTSETLINNVLQAAWQPNHADSALRLAAEHLGAAGADLLDFIWIAKPPDHDPDLDIKAKALLVGTARSHASARLDLVLQLREARTCASTKSLLPKLKTSGDARAAKELEKRRSPSGCGFFGLADCYGCLRGDPLLDDTLLDVRGRPGPRFRHPDGAAEAPDTTPGTEPPAAGSPSD